ncbi:MAG TPA: hypothetical protein VF740_04985, partial [Candidatus Acidoferrum sp.]
MRTARLLTAFMLCSLLPLSLTAQSVTPEPIPEPMPVPHPEIRVRVPVALDLHVPSPVPQPFGDSDRDLPVQAQETIEKSFSIAGAARKSLEVDNVWGSIEVVGTNSDQVQLVVNKSIRAESQDKLAQARKEVTLDITEQEGLLKLYVNGPFRCHCDDGCGHREFDGYVVKMDFKLQVPRDIDVKVKTVNEGRVVVRDINGNFLVRNVNGDVEMSNIAGSGTARTVNGPVKVTFRLNPRDASDFQTVNGNVELSFAQSLNADFRFKTFNGGIYSDFPVTALPVRAAQE